MRTRTVKYKVTGKGSLKPILIEIGNRLKELRLKKGYESLKDFTNDYELPMIQYWRIENGKANITLRSLNKLLTIHSVRMEDFFNREN